MLQRLSPFAVSLLALVGAACTQVADTNSAAPSGAPVESTSVATPATDPTPTEPPAATSQTAIPAEPASESLTGPKIVVNMANGKSFTMQLDAKNTPKTSEGIAALVKKGFYDGQRVHRVEPGFVVQWGDPISKEGVDDPRVGSGGTGKNLPFEAGKLSFDKGVLGMASTGAGVGGDCQMFVVTGDNAQFLDGKYSAFGKVVSGMDVVMKIAKGDKILSMKIAK